MTGAAALMGVGAINEDEEQSGELKPELTVVAATSGTTGNAMACE